MNDDRERAINALIVDLNATLISWGGMLTYPLVQLIAKSLYRRGWRKNGNSTVEGTIASTTPRYHRAVASQVPEEWRGR